MSTSTASSSLRRMAFFTCAILLLSFCMHIQAQNYHFSNGWHPGGKRSGLPDMQCHFRPQTKALIEKLLDEEITRIITTCTNTVNDIADLQ
uniref:Gonadotropin-releasing hormone preproprotein n=1 Tax=Acanthosepion lycidas TaxID=296134 RepID=A0A7U3LLU9_9MOLL|nr:gonadotropin-releasing hormone preproprotein [Sepia lycidas]